MTIAIYPGTFDPITKGHIDIMARAGNLFDVAYLGVVDSTNKQTLFTLEERMMLAEASLVDVTNARVISFSGLVTGLARQLDATVIIRGLRAVSDFDYEFQMAGMNRQLYPDIETVFLTPAEHLSYISSTLVREIAAYNGEVEQFVHAAVVEALVKKYSWTA